MNEIIRNLFSYIGVLFLFPLLQPIKKEFCQPKGSVRVIFTSSKNKPFSPENPENMRYQEK